MKRCPICGSKGADLVFNFYCENQLCQNYKAPMGTNYGASREDIKAVLRSMWKIYGTGETEEEFQRRFYSEGGTIYFPEPATTGPGYAKVTKPEWLKRRISEGL